MKNIRLLFITCLCIGFIASVHPSFAATEENKEKDSLSELSSTNAAIERDYGVGEAAFSWFDAGRSRQMPVKIYYPVERLSKSSLEQAGQLSKSSHESSDPVVAAKRSYPVVLFSHGLGRSREDCAYLGTYWASRGIVSVFVEHLGSNEAIWRGKLQPKKHLKDAYDNPATMRNRPLDMRFAIDQLAKMKHEGDRLAERMDLERIGAAGCDLGAETALALAGQMLPGGIMAADKRVRAVIAMSPPVPIGQVPLDAAYGDIHVPCLYMTGDADDGIVGTTKAGQRRIPFDHTFGADQYLVVFSGADHMIYSGHLRQREAGKDAYFQPLVREASMLFWAAYLQNKPEALIAIQGRGLNEALGGSANVEKKLEKKIASNKARE